jgi:hypothetical protein
LFGYNSFGTVQNLAVSGSVKGGTITGGVVGRNDNGTVQNCSFSGTVSGNSTASGELYVGGVVGLNSFLGVSTVQNCSFSGTVSGKGYVGGVVGYNAGSSGVRMCYSAGSVSGKGYVGGVVGQNNGTVQNCYSTSSVSYGADPYDGGNVLGGVVGRIYTSGTVQNCYATGSVGVYVEDYTSSYIGGVVGITEGKLQNGVALNKSLTKSGSIISTSFGRVSLIDLNPSLSSLNNYGRSDMTLPKGYSSSASMRSLDGTDVTATQWNNPSWWQNTAQFPTDAWDFSNVGNGRLPTLKNVPGTQNPTVVN